MKTAFEKTGHERLPFSRAIILLPRTKRISARRSLAALTDQNRRVAFEREVKVVLIFNRVPPGRRLGCDLYLVVDLAIVHVLLGDGHDRRAGEGVSFQRTEVRIA